MTALIPATERVTQLVTDLGGSPSRRDVLDALAQTVGYREAVAAVRSAEVFGLIERVLLPDGRVGLLTTNEGTA